MSGVEGRYERDETVYIDPQVRADRVNAWIAALTKDYGREGVTFYSERLQRYCRIVMEHDGGGRSVHAFYEHDTGDVYKAAGWKAPAKGVRYRLADDESFAILLACCDWSGRYLYVR